MIADQAVELEADPRPEDFRQALRARAALRRTRRMVLYAALGVVLAGVVWAAVVLDAPYLMAGPVAVTVGGGFLSVMMPRRLVSLLYEAATAQGRWHLRVDEEGVHARTRKTTTTLRWGHFRDYLETPDLFVLVVDDNVGQMAVLAKRATSSPADVERLQAIIDRHLKRA